MKPLADGYASHSVMIVDDLHANARLVEALLQEDGHTMQIATDGPSALRLIRAAPPDLVLLDVMMPGMDGYEVCQALKRDILTRLTPSSS